MSIFGIIASEFGSSDEHYVSEDEKVLEWLLANNYGPLEDNEYEVKAPEGYIFRCNSLFKKDALEIDGLDESELNDSIYVTVGSPENDKFLTLTEGFLKSVTRSEFAALNIPEDRVLEYAIY